MSKTLVKVTIREDRTFSLDYDIGTKFEGSLHLLRELVASLEAIPEE